MHVLSLNKYVDIIVLVNYRIVILSVIICNACIVHKSIKR